MNRVIITAPSSNSGKTTVTCALLSALRKRGMSAAAFKCGPDYIDPMFHRETLCASAYNLDPFFLSPTEMRSHIAQRHGKDITVIEGAMGFYDGIANTDTASCYTAARETRSPVILTVDARGAGNSLQAVLEGFVKHREDSGIQAVIFNGIPERRYPDMAQLAANAGLTPLGFLPFDKDNSVKSRHLGLVTAAEIDGLKQKLERLGELAEKTLDIEGIIKLSKTAPVLSESEPEFSGAEAVRRVKIAVSDDKAFCFRYLENLERLQKLGAELVYFSPLEDTALPEGISAVYLCGGYPELYAEQLSRNRKLLGEIRAAAERGMPLLAECGGFLVLGQSLDGYPMAGLLPGDTYKTERLQRFGYITMTAHSDNLLCRAGESVNAHEFHYWDSTDPGGAFTAEKPLRGTKYTCVHATDTMYAGFPHIYLTDKTARRFIEKVRSYAENDGK